MYSGFKPYPKPETFEYEPILDFTRDQICAIDINECQYSENGRSEPHHVRTLGECGVATKPHDTIVAPLCMCHHLEAERLGDERFWKKYNVDPARVVIENLTAFIKFKYQKKRKKKLPPRIRKID